MEVRGLYNQVKMKGDQEVGLIMLSMWMSE